MESNSILSHGNERDSHYTRRSASGKNMKKLNKKQQQQQQIFTSTVAPFSVSIVVGCHGAPRPIVVLSCAAVVATSFVDERENAAVTRCSSLSARA